MLGRVQARMDYRCRECSSPPLLHTHAVYGLVLSIWLTASYMFTPTPPMYGVGTALVTVDHGGVSTWHAPLGGTATASASSPSSSSSGSSSSELTVRGIHLGTAATEAWVIAVNGQVTLQQCHVMLVAFYLRATCNTTTTPYRAYQDAVCHHTAPCASGCTPPAYNLHDSKCIIV